MIRFLACFQGYWMGALTRGWAPLLAYPVAGRDQDFAAFMSSWIDLKKADGTIDRAYAHWILGRDSEPQRPRWSVIRDVLGWVE